MKIRKIAISALLALALFASLCIGAAAVTVTPLNTYPVSTGNDTPTYTTPGGAKTGTIYAEDLCTIKSLDNNYVYVTYPISGGTKTAYAKTTAFFATTSINTASITKYAAAYRRSAGSLTIGSVDQNDKTVYVTGTANGRTQIIYNVTGTNTYKLGWVDSSAVKYPTPASAPAPSATTAAAKVVAEAKKWVGSAKLPNDSRKPGGLCQAFVYQVVWNALDHNSKVDYSKSTAKEAMNAWMVSNRRDNIPLGAAVYFSSTSAAGHVGIYVGNGQVVHAWVDNTIKCQTIDSMTGTYLGWGWQAGYALS